MQLAGVSMLLTRSEGRSPSSAPQRVLADRRNGDPADDRHPSLSAGGHRQFQPKDSCLAGERHAELGHHPGAPHRGVKGPSRRVCERQRACCHRRRFGEFRRRRAASRGLKFSESCARANRHRLLELFDRSVLATIEARVAFLERPREYGGGAASRRLLRR